MSPSARGMSNLASLLVDRAAHHPGHTFGVAESPTLLGEVVDVASRLATSLRSHGVGSGTRVALVGATSPSYLLSWVALQLAGAEVALLNPGYPAELLAEIVRPLAPAAVVWAQRDVAPTVTPGAVHLDMSDVDGGTFVVDGERVPVATEVSDLPGLGREALDVAGYMHTSGTTGVPKLCVQTHEYFVRLGRFIADSLALSADDTLLTPLPLFHINPLGYAVVGGLTGHSQVVACSRFSASGFWPLVRDAGITVAVLHAPPVEILKRATRSSDAEGHRLRAVLFADEEFLDVFRVPVGLSVYGSTEVGGLSHTWTWRQGERAALPEGMSRYGGRARHDVRWTVADDGEILVAADRPGVLFSGYLTPDGVGPAVSEDGWFHTGDLGRVDELGNLVFVERAAEAIRVKGEHVPIDYVEARLLAVEGVEDVALWRRDSELVDHEVVLYVVAEPATVPGLRAAIAALPPGMRPATVVRVRGPLPRDTGVGKVRRRELGSLPVVEELSI